MLSYDVIHLFTNKKKSWISIFSILFLLSFLVNENSRQEPVNIIDHIILNLTQQYMCIIVIPLLFLILIADIVVREINDGTIAMILPRNTSRLKWLFSKAILLFFTSILFTAGCIILFYLSGAILGLSWEFVWSSQSILADTLSPIRALFLIASTYIYTLTAFGFFILLLSFLLLFNPTFSLLIGFFLIIISYFSWTASAWREYLKWTPAGQMMFLAQIPNRYTENLPGFTLTWSLIYNFTLFLVSLLVFIMVIRVKNISKME